MELIKSWRLENTNGNHNKFYEIKIYAKINNISSAFPYIMMRSYGRIGTHGREDPHPYSTLKKALKDAWKLRDAKINKGYRVVKYYDRDKIKDSSVEPKKKEEPKTANRIMAEEL